MNVCPEKGITTLPEHAKRKIKHNREITQKNGNKNENTR